MILALLILAILSVASLVATLLMGLNVLEGNHILWALFSVPFGLFTLTIHMFYFIGTGSDVKKILAKQEIDTKIHKEIRDETKLYKHRTFPMLLWAMLFQMATFVLGGAVGGGMLPPVIHLILASLALAFTLVALVLSHIMARRNFFLLLRVADLLEESGDPTRVEAS